MVDKETLRKQLIEERDRLGATAGDLASSLDIDETEQSSELSNVDQHPADAGTETFEREKDAAILTTLRARQQEVDAALKRLEAGTYGACESCGQPIGDDRLEAFPAARFCIEHQEQKEAS